MQSGINLTVRRADDSQMFFSELTFRVGDRGVGSSTFIVFICNYRCVHKCVYLYYLPVYVNMYTRNNYRGKRRSYYYYDISSWKTKTRNLVLHPISE